MGIVYQVGTTPDWKLKLWVLWREGKSLSQIGRMLGQSPATVFHAVRANGGYTPRVQTRSPDRLTAEEREEISILLGRNEPIRSIARALCRAPSTISREVNKNGGRSLYRAHIAEHRAWAKARRPQKTKIQRYPKLKRIVESKLQSKWSPEQVSGWLQVAYEDTEEMKISHESIYKSLFIQAKGNLKRELILNLRSKRKLRQARSNNFRGSPRGRTNGGISISERPADVEDRAIPGHWEGDLISGSNNSHIATLVERKSRFLIMVKLAGKDAKTVEKALKRRMKALPEEYKKSLTWDRGGELARHKNFTMATKIDVYFCDPQSPWQRGTNENTNRLIRQYLPKKTDLSSQSQIELNKISREMNRRPRLTLGFRTPAEVFSSVLP